MPSLGEPIIADPLWRAIESRAHIDSLEKKLKVASKKAISKKKKPLKA